MAARLRLAQQLPSIAAVQGLPWLPFTASLARRSFNTAASGHQAADAKGSTTTTTTTTTAAADSTAAAAGLAVGIDLGTTQSVAAFMDGTEAVIIPNTLGERTTQSVVAFTEDNTTIVGTPAKQQAAINPKGTIHAIKRLMGRSISDAQTQTVIKSVTYEVVKGDGDEAWVRPANTAKNFSPVEISSLVLASVKKSAEQYLKQAIKDVVVTVPAYFNDRQRQATKQAGALAGLNVVRVVNEPTAAALAYGIGRMQGSDKTIAVYDLGGGTFDISILHLDSRGVFEVKATNGDTFLGGEDFDNALISHIVFKAQQLTGQDIRMDLRAMQRVREAAERVKMELDHADSTYITLPFLTTGLNFNERITRAEFEGLVSSLVQRSIAPCKRCILDSGVDLKDIDEVILVGGMTRMPLVRDAVKNLFGRDPNTSVDPLEAVARGAAIQAGVLTGAIENVLLLDVTPLSLGIETLGGMFHKLIPRNTTIPTKVTEYYSTGVDNQTQVEIKVLQGERPIAKDNQMLGEFVLSDIPRAPRGTPRIGVTFTIDANGIVSVSAVEKNSGKEQHIVVQTAKDLSKEQVAKLIEEASANAESDKARQKKMEAIARGDIVVKDVLEHLARFRSQLSSDDISAIEGEVTKVKALLNEQSSIPDLDKATQGLHSVALAALQRASKGRVA